MTKKKNSKNIKQNTLKIFFHRIFYYSGAQAIKEKIFPPVLEEINKPSYRKPSTGFLWLVGIYFTLFGIASQRYENINSRIEFRTSAVFAQLQSGAVREALEMIPEIQNLPCPVKPEIYRLDLICRSIFFKDSKSENANTLLAQVIEIWSRKKDALNGLNLRNLNLENANLSTANFIRVDLQGANFKGADLSDTNFKDATLIGTNFEKGYILDANFKGSNLTGANFKNTFLNRANFEDTDLSIVDFEGADLSEVNLKNSLIFLTKFKSARGLKVKYLLQARRLAGVRGLNQEMINEIKKLKPDSSFISQF